MTPSSQAHSLLQIGIGLLLFVSFEGFVIPRLPSPRIGLSVHTLGTFEALIFLVFGLLWSTLRLSSPALTVTFWLFVYSAFATYIPYVLAAIWGAGGSTIPLAAGSAHGSKGQEAMIKIVLYSAAPTGIAAFALMMWGLSARQ